MNKSKIETYLSLCALGEDKPGIVTAFAKAAKSNQCSIVSSKLSVSGDTFALIIHFIGSWHAIAKLESALQKLAQKHEWQLQLKLNQNVNTTRTSTVPYYVQVISQDRLGIIHDLTSFFSRKSINIEELQSEIFFAPKTTTVMAHLSFNIYVPIKTNIAAFRESFMLYSEEHNLDVVMEPIK